MSQDIINNRFLEESVFAIADVLGHIHIEADIGAGLLESQTRLVELDTDANLAIGVVRATGGHCEHACACAEGRYNPA